VSDTAVTSTEKSTSEKLLELFAGSDLAHGTHGEPDQHGLKWTIKRTARTVPGAVTVETWRAHLKGTTPLGVIPIRHDGTCWWGSVDLDQYDANLSEIIERVERAKLPLVPCRSKSGGLHLFLLLKQPESAEAARSALQRAAKVLGLPDDCEIFPKQVEIDVDRKDVGNWIVMPYFGDTFGGKLKTQVGLKRSGAEMTTEEFVRKCEASRTIARGIREQAAASPDTAQEVRRSLRPRSIAGSQGPDGLPRRSGVPGAHARGRLQADGRSQARALSLGHIRQEAGHRLAGRDRGLQSSGVRSAAAGRRRGGHAEVLSQKGLRVHLQGRADVRSPRVEALPRPAVRGRRASPVPVIVGWREVVYGEDHVCSSASRAPRTKRFSSIASTT
jgi:hypothetical protein